MGHRSIRIMDKISDKISFYRAFVTSTFLNLNDNKFCVDSSFLPQTIFLLHYQASDSNNVKMESLSDTLWDVVICGTGLQQSLLAL